jgi:NADPH:quinone reductase-like Zn-dependent oxidoreductase
MHTVELTKHGAPDVLKVVERADPPLPPGHVRVAVAACGVNFADVAARVGLYPDAPKPPCVIGYEVSGTVLELGEGVEGLTHGQRVIAGTRFGGYASQVSVPERDCTPLPERLTFEQGAAIPVNYATAYAALVAYGNIQPGERVLIHSVGGGVGIAAAQLARRFGAGEIWGTASPAKHPRVRELPVDRVLDYPEATPKGSLPRFDIILNALGGRSLRTSYEMLRPGGRLIAFGVSGVISGPKRKLIPALRTVLRSPRFFSVKQISESKAVIGLNMLTLWNDRDTLQPWIAPLRELLDDDTIAPVIAGAFPFEQAPAAHEMLTSRRNFGKVVLVT